MPPGVEGRPGAIVEYSECSNYAVYAAPQGRPPAVRQGGVAKCCGAGLLDWHPTLSRTLSSHDRCTIEKHEVGREGNLACRWGDHQTQGGDCTRERYHLVHHGHSFSTQGEATAGAGPGIAIAYSKAVQSGQGDGMGRGGLTHRRCRKRWGCSARMARCPRRNACSGATESVNRLRSRRWRPTLDLAGILGRSRARPPGCQQQAEIGTIDCAVAIQIRWHRVAAVPPCGEQ